MRYLMKQKIWSWGNNFVIKNDRDEACFQVHGQVFSFGDKLSFCDMADNELVFIRQKVFSWGPTYELHRPAGEPSAMVSKHLWTFFKDRFTVDVTADGPSPDDLLVQGDFWDLEYQFIRQDRPIASVSKKWFSWADTFGVDVAGGE